MSTAATEALLARFEQLPDLLDLAVARNTPDRYAEQERLARQHDAQKKTYRLSMPHRRSLYPCSSGAHQVPAIQYTLVNPLRNERMEVWEAALHEARAQARPSRQRRYGFSKGSGRPGRRHCQQGFRFASTPCNSTRTGPR